MQGKMSHVVSFLLLAVNRIAAYQPYDFDQYNDTYISSLRDVLDSFHVRLSSGIIPEDTYSSDIHWNFDGNLVISDIEWGNALRAVVGPGGVFGDLNIPDYYQLVDGNICGTMYDLQGNQSGDFLGLPVQPGARFNVHGAELWVFDQNLEANRLITIQPTGRIRAQFAGEIPVPPPIPRGSQNVQNQQMPQEYRDARRRALSSMHKNVLSGNPEANAVYALNEVVVDDVGDIRTGKEAFVEIIAAQQQGLGAFPVKQIHDEYIIVDGRLGAVEYIWHGKQKKEYLGRAPDDKMVRVRAMLWFEFDPAGMVEKVVSVHDERVVLNQLEDNVGYMLYP